MTKFSPKPCKKTARISVRPCCFVNLSSSSESSPLTISSPIRDDTSLTLATPNQSHIVITTPPPTKTPTSPPPAPIQTSKTPSPPSPPRSPTLIPMELFSTPPTSPNPFLEDLDDLPPRPNHPPPLPSFGTIERIAHESPRSSFDPNAPLGPKPLLFHPIHKDIHGPLYGDHPLPTSMSPHLEDIEECMWDANPTREEIQAELHNLHQFKGMVDSHLSETMQMQNALLASIMTTPNIPNTTNTSTIPPPQPSQTYYPPRHGCSTCEQTAQTVERTRVMVHDFQEEMRFILNHILERLNALSHPPSH